MLLDSEGKSLGCVILSGCTMARGKKKKNEIIKFHFMVFLVVGLTLWHMGTLTPLQNPAHFTHCWDNMKTFNY